ncbi:four helix bundle protein [Patescibacteria group bacterium]|nr:four helix bundle protein [Patescibacteria group bacterium]
MFKFERLEVWKKAVETYELISEETFKINQKDQYSLGEQIRRSSLSISTNIAEGTGRNSSKEAKYFFNIAKGSVYETVSLLVIMKKRGYLEEEKFREFYNICDEIAMMLSGLMNK